MLKVFTRKLHLISLTKKLIAPNNKHLVDKSAFRNTNETQSKYIPKITHNQQFINDSVITHIKITNRDLITPKPIHMILAIDTSSSMNEPCTSNNSKINDECSKFSRMDLVKHSCKLITNCLRPEDKLSLVQFSFNASIIIDNLNLSIKNKKKILNNIDKIKIGGMTNIYDGAIKSETFFI